MASKPAKRAPSAIGDLKNALRESSSGVPQSGGHGDRSNLSFMVKIDDIMPDPDQPRRRFDEGSLNWLVSSFGRVGQLQPILVREPKAGEVVAPGIRYIIVAGERRWRAAKLIGWDQINSMRSRGDHALAQMAENLHRADLTPFEVASGIVNVMSTYGYTQEQAGSELGFDQTTISDMVRINTLPAFIHQEHDQGNYGTTRSVLLQIARAETLEEQKRLWELAKAGETVVAIRAARTSKQSTSGVRPERAAAGRATAFLKFLDKQGTLDRGSFTTKELRRVRKLRDELTLLLGE